MTKNNTSRPFAALATVSPQREFERAAQHLTVYYVLGILAILVFSSVAVYSLFSVPSAPAAPVCLNDACRTTAEHHLDFNFFEFREHIESVLLVVDIIVLIFGGIFAYFFARRTLRPIEVMYRDQEQFMADVAHELRTPLAVLRSGAEVLLRKEREPQEYVTYINEMQDETHRMTRIVNDLLFLLKFKRQQTSPMVVVDFSTLVGDQVHQFTDYAAEHKVALQAEIDPDITVYGISDSLVRLLQNVLKNAIDYNRPDGVVTVSLTQDVALITLTVRDTGVGIPKEDQAHVFDRFYKSDRSRAYSETAGTGLGLAIVQEIVTAHYGTITLESEPDQGTTVTVRFPHRSTNS